MNWEKALLKIDVVKDKEDLISAIEGISKNPDEGVGDIDKLIKAYKDDNERIFIQKYAETQLATNGINIAISAYIIALVSILISIFFAYSSLRPLHPTPLVIASFMLIVPTIALLGAIYFKLICHVDPHINRYNAIIIAIGAAKLGNLKKAKKLRHRVELNKKDTKIICILILFIIAICQSFIILELISP